MHVIGTAGHVDHGKSALVEALTGTHPDRLKEEREREMTIDLGFAWFELPGGEPVGVVDVPGHRDFIENMLAGVGGIEAALLVVAADEGVMPQTREHLAILDLLDVRRAVVAITKADLAESPDWISLIAADVQERLSATALAGAPWVGVSARTGQGLDELKSRLADVLAITPPRADHGRPRLPVDRVFSMPGFGTVVTGTLIDGGLSVGDELEILPSGRRARIRGLQTHKQKIERALPGSRVAVNLSGVEIADLARGDVLAHQGLFRPTTLVDVHIRHLPDAAHSLKHNAEVKVFAGSAEVMARARLLGTGELRPGESGWAQLELSAPLAFAKGDRVVLRRPSPGETIGGGVVVDPNPAHPHRRNDPRVLARLESARQGTPGEILLQALEAKSPGPLDEAIRRAGLEPAAASEAISELTASAQLILLNPDFSPNPASPELVVSRARWSRLERDLLGMLTAYHSANPLRPGMPREELKSRLGLTPKVFNAVLGYAARSGAVVESGAAVRLSSHEVRLSPEEQARADSLIDHMRAEPFNTPSPNECAALAGEEVYAVLLDRGTLVALSSDVVLLGETYAAAVERITSVLADGSTITVAGVRDLFATSRKYALALMESLDRAGVTVRVGDERKLKRTGEH